MNDQSKWFVVKTILLNDRLKMYKKYIEKAKQLGYKCCSFIEYYHERETADKYLILRHDVDYDLKATRKMFNLEKSLNVTSTYYFRDCTFDYNLMQEIKAAGFEVGYHYETLANLANAKGFTKKEQIDLDEGRELFKKELKYFEQRAGFKMLSCADHGHEKNVELGISNNAIFENINSKALSVEFEAYNKNLYDNYIECHIMDCPIDLNFGYSYKNKNPQNAFSEGKRVIVFLAHPCHWYLSLRAYAGRCQSLITGQITYSTERTYKRIAM